MADEKRIQELIDTVLGKEHVSCGDWRDDRMAIELGGAEARKELVEIGLPAVPYLIPHIRDNYIRWVLRDIGGPAVPPLLDELAKSPQTKKYVIQVLGDLKASSPAVNDALLPLLSEGKLGLRILAAKALGKRREERAFEPMMELLREMDKVKKQRPNQVLFALGWLGDKRAVPIILPYLKAEDPLVRLGAAKALGWLGDRKAAKPLVKLLKQELDSGLTRETHSLICEIAHALGKLGDQRAIRVVEAAANILPAPKIIRALEKLKDK